MGTVSLAGRVRAVALHPLWPAVGPKLQRHVLPPMQGFSTPTLESSPFLGPKQARFHTVSWDYRPGFQRHGCSVRPSGRSCIGSSLGGTASAFAFPFVVSRVVAVGCRPTPPQVRPDQQRSGSRSASKPGGRPAATGSTPAADTRSARPPNQGMESPGNPGRFTQSRDWVAIGRGPSVVSGTWNNRNFAIMACTRGVPA